MKHIIIGGVAGGATAAARIRRADEFAEIILLEKGNYISYANCGLPYYIGGTISRRENLFLQTPQSFGRRFNMDVRTGNEAIEILPSTKSIRIRKASGEEYVEQYDKLLLSPGAKPLRPPLSGIDCEGIFTLRNVADTDSIKQYINSREVKKAVIVGAGFIGLEMAENLHHAGAEVTIVEMSNQVMAPIDFSMAAQVHQYLTQKGVSLRLGESVGSFSKEGNQILIRLKNGDSMLADIVILSIGVRPETALANAAGIRIGETGGIWVNEYMETSEKDIYAVGDAIEFPHPLTGKPWLNYLANPANRQGRIVADNMVYGNTTKYEGAIGTAIAKVFDMTVASTGLAAKRLKQMGIDYRSSWTHSNSHAGYYPDALPLSLKLTFDPTSGKLYGAQCVGYDGVDKRIDQIAMLIKKGGTVYDLAQTEHAYAPPYSSAKDPVAIAGYVASNIISGAMPAVSWRELQQADPDKILLLDVRTESEFSMGNIPGAMNIPLDDLRDRLSEIPENKTLYIYCAVGLRGYLACNILMARGYNACNVSGGYKTYTAATDSVVCNTELKKEIEIADMDQQSVKSPVKTLRIDACGLQCPGPVLKLKQGIDTLSDGECLEMVATDAGFARDAQAWCNTTGNRLVSQTEEKGKYTVIIEKGTLQTCVAKAAEGSHGKTFILFSDDLDKALATFVLANGAAAAGGKITIFFTFWGLNVIKKAHKPKVNKDLFGKMFEMMLPSNSLRLKLSKMNMFGAGSRMMRHIMKQKGVDSLESLREQAIAQGVEFIACQMSMDVMGVKREELLNDVTIGGVASYMERAGQANVNLFV
ncbi:MAG: FAD-dependent oxidoreductase [Tannerellaceae bacterium]|jgi:NADPH-dependent 2,4-dienoyl-CoA reductase/sulfur reductase-like enzyme/peroxiredoxin family protein/rhodanese-related sulfurtransferase/TusA-related sulfurtransferase|nr:FAD-dependent oxidoreductase [Tannerellaceae bacterium]